MLVKLFELSYNRERKQVCIIFTFKSNRKIVPQERFSKYVNDLPSSLGRLISEGASNTIPLQRFDRKEYLLFCL